MMAPKLLIALLGILGLALARDNDPMETAWPAGRNLKDSFEEACRVTAEGGIFTTMKPINIRYFYEVLAQEGPLRIGFKIETAIKNFLIKKLILEPCTESNPQAALIEDVRGIEVGGSGVLSENVCSKLKSELKPGLSCYTMVGSNTIYLDDTVDTDFETVENTITDEVYTVMQENGIGLSTEDGVFAITTISGTDLTNDSEEVQKEENGVKGVESTALGDEIQSSQPPQRDADPVDNPLSLTGILLLLISAALFTLATLYMWIAMRTKEEEEYELEEELSRRDEAASYQYRILVGTDSRAEVDVTDEICFCYTTDEEIVEEAEVSNPFAVREGRTLQWKNVNMTVTGAGDEPDKCLLDNVWGEVPRGQTTAIMGASGAGKSSLLNILSGRTRSKGRLEVEADVRLDNYAVEVTDMRVRKSIAFVAQDDSLQVTATPREAIRFSAKLRLPSSTTDEDLDTLTKQMLYELGLEKCADTIMGGPLVKGVSGGERKRTSVGVELVTKPSMVFLDEPTSGLDSYSAVQCVDVLKRVANAGASVLFTIHQPSSEIFESIEHLILLHQGRLLYNGSVASVPEYFRERGYQCPRNYNPADFILTVAQSVPAEELEEHGFFPEDFRILGDPLRPSDGLGPFSSKTINGVEKKLRTPGYWTQTKLLFSREVKNTKRDKTVFLARVILTVIIAAFVGSLFLNVGQTDSTKFFNLHSHFGAITAVSAVMMIITSQTALVIFPTERPVFLREYTTDHYSIVSYFASRLAMEVIITGILCLTLNGIAYFMVNFEGTFRIYYLANFALAMTSTAYANTLGAAAGANKKLATTSLPIVFIPQLLFAGFFVTPSLIPFWVRWVQYLCPLTYGIRLVLLSEFGYCSPEEEQDCLSLLEKMGADPDDSWWYWLILLAQFTVFRLIAVFLLKKNAQTFY